LTPLRVRNFRLLFAGRTISFFDTNLVPIALALALVFLPAGYAIAGPVAMGIGVSTSLWIAAGWILVSTVLVLRFPSVRAVRRDEPPAVQAVPA